MMDWNLIQQIASIVAGVIATVATMTWWLHGQFNHMRQYTEVMFEKLMNKLEYHERHDDQRFGELRDDLWEMRLRIAANRINTKTVDDFEDQKEFSRRRKVRTPETGGSVT